MKHGADDKGAKKLGDPPGKIVEWTVTHLVTHETKTNIHSQSAYGAAYIAGWALADCMPKRVT